MKTKKIVRMPAKNRAFVSLKQHGIFSLSDAKQRGISQPTLSRLVSNGTIHRVARGQYLLSNSEIDGKNIDFILACKKFGKKAAIAGLSALAYYKLIEEVPRRIWIVVPPNIKTIDSHYRCIRSTTDSEIGIIQKKKYRITNLERTIVEAFRYSHKIGLRVAIQAARSAIKDRRTNEVKLLRQAKELGLEKYLLKYWEAIIPEAEGL